MSALETTLKWYGKDKTKEMQNAMVTALMRSANLVQSTAKLLVPVDTANLRASIVRSVDPRTLVGIVSTNVEYAIHVEFGAKRQKAQPFMRPGLKDNIDNINKIFVSEGKKVTK